MLPLQKYRNKKIAIYGMGMTGFSVAKTLRKLGIKIFCWDDSAKIRRKIKNQNFSVGKFWIKKNWIDNVVISPGIDIDKCNWNIKQNCVKFIIKKVKSMFWNRLTY